MAIALTRFIQFLGRVPSCVVGRRQANLEVLMWKRIAAVSVSAGALVAAGLVGAAPASADSTHYAANPDGQARAGLGQFASYGEWFYACDELGDGYGVKVNWHVVDNPSNNGSAWARGGAGSCDSSNATVAE